MGKGDITFSFYERSTSLIKCSFAKIKKDVQVINNSQEKLNKVQLHTLSGYNVILKKKLSEFENNFQRIIHLYDEDEAPQDILSNDQDEIMTMYVEINGMIEALMISNDSLNQSQVSDANSQASTTTHHVRLPKLELKHFDGNPVEWISFINLFNTAIHNNESITDITKFQYLLSVLSDEPLNLVKSLNITAPNYKVAYDLLHERYQNIRRLTSLHLNKILDLPNISASSITNLRIFVNTFYEQTQALKALECDISTEPNPLLTALILRKMDDDLRRKLEAHRSLKNADESTSHSLPLIKTIFEFLNSECSQVEDADLHSPSGSQTKLSSTSISKSQKPQTFMLKKVGTSPRGISMISTPSPETKPKGFGLSTNFKPCFGCQQSTHKIYTCPIFKGKSAHERYQLVKSNKRCVSCLGNHLIKDCKSQATCYICHKKHHTLLHYDTAQNNTSTDPPEFTSRSSTETPSPTSKNTGSGVQNNFVGMSSDNNTTCTNTTSTVLLGTTLIKVTAQNGITHVFRALLDSGSMCDFLSEKAAQLLNAPRIKSSHSIVGISQTTTKTKGIMPLTVESLSGKSIAKKHPFFVLNKISTKIPHTDVSSDVMLKIKPYTLADPTFHLPGDIDILLGGALFPSILTHENYSLGPSMPHVIGTKCGFIVMGQAPCSSPLTTPANVFLSTNDVDLHSSLQKFWQQEEPPQVSKQSEEEIICDKHFLKTHSRDSQGRYIVRLPFKSDPSKIGESITAAEQRLSSLERKFSTNPQFKNLYVNFMEEYLESGHMELLNSPIDFNEPHYFLPHHGVLKTNANSTKLRTVFDASCKTNNDVSLNDILLTGPKLQTNITDILLSFRCFNVVFTCDIRQMYRQIKIHQEDQKYQLILWRNSPQEPISTFKLTTVTYGLNSSPFLALRTLAQLATDEGHHFPRAANVLRTQTYVDDILCGGDNEEDALQLQQELVKLLSKGGFELRKWVSNNPTLLGTVLKEHCESPAFLDQSNNPHFSVLGMKWSPNTDTFCFQIELKDEMNTKRQILSMICTIFDPIGFISPVTMWAKSFLQLLWTKGLKWDQPLPPELADKWRNFVSSFDCLKLMNVPRPFQFTSSCNIQLHGFCDASESGYAAVIYFRCEAPEGSVVVRQVLSKTRVAPLKKVSLPRLELSGAHLLSQLVNYCQSIFSQKVSFSSINLWSDSSIALTWIQTPPFRLKTYVANRVAQIQEWTPPHLWSHISSKHNPADCASRGISPFQLLNHPLWWSGPEWLSLHISEWPEPKFTPTNLNECVETKQDPITVLTTTSRSEEWDLLKRYSSFPKLQRVMAYILRFIHNIRNIDKLNGPLMTTELKNSENHIFKLVQSSRFSEDINRLKLQQMTSTQLRSLTSFLDENGILRVGGRLNASQLTYGARHPVILPKKHHVVDLLIDHIHLKYLHAGAQLTQSLLTQTVWILSARSAIRSRIFKCVTCFKNKPRNLPPLMGNLPKPRVTASRPFLHTGVDYAGPFTVKIQNLRTVRHSNVYLCVFVCLVTKAAHLEAVTDLTAEAFIACLTRFTSRRGLSSDIYSDCGTNFVGAKSILQKLIKTTIHSPDSRRKIQEFSAPQGIRFHFNPPAAPHQGGLWESCVKSVKHHLRRVMGETVLTLMQFITLLTQIEAMLNSRPLTPLSSDPKDLNALTPGHFLIGSPLVAVPEPELQDVPNNRLKHWQLVQALQQRIWKRWHLEYIHTLMERKKWKSMTDNLQVGDLVLIHQPTPPLSWPLARITHVYPGQDNVVRVVRVKTQSGSMTRPAHKLFRLPQ